MCGFYFALRSGKEHRSLRYSPSQIELVEKLGSHAYLHYREDVSKTNQGGLSSRSKPPKEVTHYENTVHPKRCFVRIYKLYMARCSPDRPPNAFYLQPLAEPRGDIWYSKTPCGHNALQKVVPGLMKSAGYSGYYANHSLRASCATRLFDSGVDEQLIMNRTGHDSKEGVRAYKRTTTKLNELTSDVLNGSEVKDKSNVELASEDAYNKPKASILGGKKNLVNPLLMTKKTVCNQCFR